MSELKQRYWNSSVGYVTIESEITEMPGYVVVRGGDSYGMEVIKRDQLVPEEETWEYKEAGRRKAEIEKITEKAKANMDKLADKLVDEALIALASRMKFNAFFGKGGTADNAAWAVMVIKELEGLVKDKAANVVAGKKDSIF